MDPYLAAARDEIHQGVGGLSPDALSRPGATPASWTIAQILEHLTLAFTANAAAFEKALASGEARARPAGLKQRMGRVLVVDLGYFPRAKAPEMTVPTGSIPVDASVATLHAALERLDGILDQVAARFGLAALVANHPYFGGMTVPQWRKFHWRHCVHHMRQVRQRGP